MFALDFSQIQDSHEVRTYVIYRVRFFEEDVEEMNPKFIRTWQGRCILFSFSDFMTTYFDLSLRMKIQFPWYFVFLSFVTNPVRKSSYLWYCVPILFEDWLISFDISLDIWHKPLWRCDCKRIFYRFDLHDFRVCKSIINLTLWNVIRSFTLSTWWYCLNASKKVCFFIKQWWLIWTLTKHWANFFMYSIFQAYQAVNYYIMFAPCLAIDIQILFQ